MARRPDAAELEAARTKRLRDVLEPGLDVVFCGINPSLYSAALGHHFARPGNRFWPALHRGGFTDRLLAPEEDGLLPSFGCGLTNVAPRATPAADELTRDELRRGMAALERTLERFAPRTLAFLGVSAYREALGERRAAIGPQERTLGGARVWLLPNPSGRAAHYQLPELARLYAKLRKAVRR